MQWRLKFFLSSLNEIKGFVLSEGEDASIIEDQRWILDLVFLTDLSKKMYHVRR